MSPAAFPAQPSSTSRPVALASASKLVLDAHTPSERRDSDQLPSENEAFQGVRPDNTWITARAEVVRVSHARPLLAAVLEIGDIQGGTPGPDPTST